MKRTLTLNMGRNFIHKIIGVLGFVVKCVLKQWPLWLTMVLTLIPMTWNAWEYHLIWQRDFPWFYLLECLVVDSSVVAVAATLVVVLVSVLPGRRFIKALLYILLLSMWLVSLFLLRNFHTTITPEVLQLLIETNRGESTEFLQAWIGAPGTQKSFIIVLFTLACVIIAEWKRKAVASVLSRRPYVILASVLLAALLAFGAWNWRVLLRPYHSLYELELTQSESHSNDLLSKLHHSILTLKFQGEEADVAIEHTLREAATGKATCRVDTMDLVLVIGESYNKWHSSLYGYGLDTSPLMCAERDRGLLTVFTDAISPYNLTSVTLKNLFSLNSLGHGEHWKDFPMWTAVMKRAGWQVDMWDNQRAFMANDLFSSSLNMLLYHPDIVKKVYHDANDGFFNYDGELVENYFTKCTTGPRNLVIFHLMGQHTEFKQRYPHTPQWDVWTIDQLPNAKAPYLDDSRREIMLEYARATRYNDRVLADIIEHYRDRNAVVVMLSDHGEEVYDYRDFMERDHNPEKTPLMVRHENEIPLMVWCSPVYKTRHPDRAAAIRAAAHRPVMNDAIGQMMLWLGEVSSPWCDSTRNALHPAYQPAPRIIYDNIDYDKLMGRK